MPTLPRLAALALAVVVPTAALAQPAAPGTAARRPPPAAATTPAKAPTLKLPTLEQWTLANGLRVAYLRHDAAPVVAVEVWYRAGWK
ncbi:MAG: insulinase family protein, partial [Kofleriaceae bacterium]|nr:insulinase family protein [Kofleriaceae bacterium]